MKLEKFINKLEQELKERYDACEDHAATPSSILLAVLNAVASANETASADSDLDGIISEITAGMVMLPDDCCDRTWNGAHKRIVSILQKYVDGEGLFQQEKD